MTFDYQRGGLMPNVIFGYSCMSCNGKNVLAMRHAQLNWFWPSFCRPSCFSDISVRYHNFGPNYRFYFIFNKLTVCHEAFEKKKFWVSTTAILSAILFFSENTFFSITSKRVIQMLQKLNHILPVLHFLNVQFYGAFGRKLLLLSWY